MKLIARGESAKQFEFTTINNLAGLFTFIFITLFFAVTANAAAKDLILFESQTVDYGFPAPAAYIPCPVFDYNDNTPYPSCVRAVGSTDIAVGSYGTFYIETYSESAIFYQTEMWTVTTFVPSRSKISLTSNGTSADSISIPITRNASGYGKSANFCVRGVSAGINTLWGFAPYSATGNTLEIAVVTPPPPPPPPSPTPTPTPTPLSTFDANWTSLTLGEVKPASIKITHGPANYSGNHWIAERLSNTTGTAYIGLSASPDGPFASAMAVQIQLNASGNGGSPTFYVKGLAPTNGQTAPTPALFGDNTLTAALGLKPYEIEVPAIELNDRTDHTIQVGVGVKDRNYVEVHHGQPGAISTIRLDAPNNGALSLSLTQDGTFSNQVDVPIEFDSTGYGKSDYFWVKGLKTKTTNYDPSIWATYHHLPSDWGFSDSFSYDVTNVVSVVVERVAGATQCDMNPNAGGGFRVYSEKPNAFDTNAWNERIKVTAKLNVPKAGVDIDFLAFDMDDPSSDDPDVDPNGATGRDNRGGLGSMPTLSNTTTNANGEAYQVYTLSNQPGDNYRFTAASRGDRLNSFSDVYYNIQNVGPNLTDSEGNGFPLGSGTSPTQTIVQSSMYTVWRRLHIERDSMGAVTGNKIESTVAGTSVNRGTTITLNGVSLEPDRFEHGRIGLTNPVGVHQPITYYQVIGSSTISVTIAGQVTGIDGYKVVLYDDDDMNSNDGDNKDGDYGEDVPQPDTALMRDSDDPALNLFAPAYIRPTYDLTGNDNSLPFYANQPQANTGALSPTLDERLLLQKFDNVALRKDKLFWVAYVVDAYQIPEHRDHDPEGDADEYILNSYYGVESPAANVMIYAEQIGDTHNLRLLGPLWTETEPTQANVTAHELAHLMHAEHTDLDLMDVSDPFFEVYFSNKSLAHFRGSLLPESGEY